MKEWEQFLKEHESVAAWLNNRPHNTRRALANRLRRFCESVELEPEEWRHLNKFEARDYAWKFVEPLIREHSTVAAGFLVALKSWFRNLDGEQLPLDSNRGGKHYLHIHYKKPAYEHIPDKKEMYRIVDMASSLRDKAVLLFLFQSGCRVNVLEHIKYGDVEDQLDQDTITLKITGDLDHKLRSRDIPFYITFLNGEATETLKQYCKLKHKQTIKDKPLFPTSGKKAITQKWIWNVVKMCTERAGLDPKSISTHTIRKAFRKIVRRADIRDDDDREQLMGHQLKQSREAYYDKNDIPLILKAYQQCNFSRELPESEVSKLQQQLEDSRLENRLLKDRQRNTEDELDKIITRLEKQDSELGELKKLIRERTSQT